MHGDWGGAWGEQKNKTKDDGATQRAFRSTSLPTLGDDAHPAAHAAPRVRGLVHVLGATLAGAERRVRLGGVPHAHVARASGPDGGAADRAGHDHARERRVVALVRRRGGEGARGRGAEARRGAARARADRFGAAQDRAVRPQDLVRWEDIDRRGRTRGACPHLPLLIVIISLCCVKRDKAIFVSAPFSSDADFREGGPFMILIFSFQSVVLYWVSSATFGLLQTWLFDYWDRRRSNPRSLASTSRQSVPQSGPTATRDKATQALASVSRQKRR